MDVFSENLVGSVRIGSLLCLLSKCSIGACFTISHGSRNYPCNWIQSVTPSLTWVHESWAVLGSSNHTRLESESVTRVSCNVPCLVFLPLFVLKIWTLLNKVHLSKNIEQDLRAGVYRSVLWTCSGIHERCVVGSCMFSDKELQL